MTLHLAPSKQSPWPYGDPTIHVRRLDSDAVAVLLSGEIDIACANRVREALGRIASVTRDTVVDLSAATFLDATGLGLLCHARNAARAHAGRLATVCPAGQPLRVLRTADMARTLLVRPTLAEALAAIRGLPGLAA